MWVRAVFSFEDLTHHWSAWPDRVATAGPNPPCTYVHRIDITHTCGPIHSLRAAFIKIFDLIPRFHRRIFKVFSMIQGEYNMN